MTTTRNALADAEAGYTLALVLKHHADDHLPTPDAAVLLWACCWVLADLIAHAETTKGIPVEHAMASTFAKLNHALAVTLATSEHDAEAVRH